MSEELLRNNSSLQGSESQNIVKVMETSVNQESTSHTFTLAVLEKLALVTTIFFCFVLNPQVINHLHRKEYVQFPHWVESLLRGLPPGFLSRGAQLPLKGRGLLVKGRQGDLPNTTMW